MAREIEYLKSELAAYQREGASMGISGIFVGNGGDSVEGKDRRGARIDNIVEACMGNNFNLVEERNSQGAGIGINGNLAEIRIRNNGDLAEQINRRSARMGIGGNLLGNSGNLVEEKNVPDIPNAESRSPEKSENTGRSSPMVQHGPFLPTSVGNQTGNENGRDYGESPAMEYERYQIDHGSEPPLVVELRSQVARLQNQSSAVMNTSLFGKNAAESQDVRHFTRVVQVRTYCKWLQ